MSAEPRLQLGRFPGMQDLQICTEKAKTPASAEGDGMAGVRSVNNSTADGVDGSNPLIEES